MDDDAAARLSLSDHFSRAAQWTSQQCGRAYTFIAAILVILVWAGSGPAFGYSDTWQLIINTGTTIITFLMVFLIQNTQNRDTTAIQLRDRPKPGGLVAIDLAGLRRTPARAASGRSR